MLALIAVILFALGAFRVELGSVDFVALGLAFLAAHLLVGNRLDLWDGRRRA